MDHIKNLEVKDIRVLLCYHTKPEKLKGNPKKVGLLEASTGRFRKYWGCIVQREGKGMYVVKNESGRKYGEDTR